MTTTRDFTVATFVVRGEQVLLVYHRALGMWLPPGGHVEPHELPDDAAVREVREETGVVCELVGERALSRAYPRQLIRPEGVQLERIAPGHEHIDLVYFARPLDDAIVPGHECDRPGWYGLEELEPLGVNDEIREWCARAVEKLGACARMPRR